MLGARAQSCVLGGCGADARVFPGSRSLPVPVLLIYFGVTLWLAFCFKPALLENGDFLGQKPEKLLLSAKLCGSGDEERETATAHLRLSPVLQPRALAPKGWVVELETLGAGCGIRQEHGV